MSTQSSSRKVRKNDGPEEKVAILRRHWIEKIPVSQVCQDARTTIGSPISLTNGSRRPRSSCKPLAKSSPTPGHVSSPTKTDPVPRVIGPTALTLI